MVQSQVFQLGVPEFLEETVAEIVAFLTRFLGALVVLLIGWVVGVAVGWGGHTYVQENVGGWMERASEETPAPRAASRADAGEQTSRTTEWPDAAREGPLRNRTDGRPGTWTVPADNRDSPGRVEAKRRTGGSDG